MSLLICTHSIYGLLLNKNTQLLKLLGSVRHKRLVRKWSNKIDYKYEVLESPFTTLTTHLIWASKTHHCQFLTQKQATMSQNNTNPNANANGNRNPNPPPVGGQPTDLTAAFNNLAVSPPPPPPPFVIDQRKDDDDFNRVWEPARRGNWRSFRRSIRRYILLY